MQFSKAIIIPALVLVAACTTIIDRAGIAEEIAAPAGFTQHRINAGFFSLTTFERVQPGESAVNIYIEGDGLAWIDRRTPSINPTPTDPVALRLAAADPSNNVIYLARPCQYSMLADGKRCPQKYWTSHRFAPEVLEAMNIALNKLKQQYGFTGINLIGYSGGANLAALIAASRGDVVSLRTVAGNLNNSLLNSMHKVSPMPNSLDAIDVAHSLVRLPQHHFYSTNDNVISPEIAYSFAKAAGNSSCIRLSAISGTKHAKGWAEQWPNLYAMRLDCFAPYK